MMALLAMENVALLLKFVDSFKQTCYIKYSANQPDARSAPLVMDALILKKRSRPHLFALANYLVQN